MSQVHVWIFAVLTQGYKQHQPKRLLKCNWPECQTQQLTPLIRLSGQIHNNINQHAEVKSGVFVMACPPSFRLWYTRLSWSNIIPAFSISSPFGGEPGGEGSSDRQWLVSSIIIEKFRKEVNYLPTLEVLIQKMNTFLWIWEERVFLDVSKPHQLSLQLAVLTLDGKDVVLMLQDSRQVRLIKFIFLS